MVNEYLIETFEYLKKIRTNLVTMEDQLRENINKAILNPQLDKSEREKLVEISLYLGANRKERE